MRKIHIITEYVPLFAGMLMLLSSCEHKDLCFDHDPHAPKSEVRIEAEYEKEWQYTYEGSTDWKNYPTWQESFGMEYDALRPGIPDGLRMQVYNADGSDEIVNIAPEGEVVYMRPGGTLPAVLQQRHGIHRVRRDAVVRFGKGDYPYPYPFFLSR